MEKSETVKRYSFNWTHGICESLTGNYVRAADFDALSAQVRELWEEKLTLEGALQSMGEAATRLANEKRELSQSLATAREEGFGQAQEKAAQVAMQYLDSALAVPYEVREVARGIAVGIRALKPTTEAGEKKCE